MGKMLSVWIKISAKSFMRYSPFSCIENLPQHNLWSLNTGIDNSLMRFLHCFPFEFEYGNYFFDLFLCFSNSCLFLFEEINQSFRRSRIVVPYAILGHKTHQSFLLEALENLVYFGACDVCLLGDLSRAGEAQLYQRFVD